MWTEYRDKQRATRASMLDDEKNKVVNAMRRGEMPPKGADLQHVIEVLWESVQKLDVHSRVKIPKTYPTHD